MNEFKSELLKNKVISVWGIGYLGYTTILRLVKAGFNVNVFHFDNIDLKSALENHAYPTLEQKSLWSLHTDIPNVDLSKISIKENVDEMFNASVHIIAMPIIGQKETTLNALLEVFENNKSKKNNTLILFQAAETPGVIENKFISCLGVNNTYSYASAFRSDWNIEEFFSEKSTRVIAGYSDEALHKAKILFEILNIKYIELSSIKESEIYINAKNSLEFTISGFFNQLSLTYSDIDINNLSSKILSNLNTDDSNPGFSSTDFKNANSIEHLLEGSNNSHFCTIIKEAQSANISLLLEYAELLKRNGIDSVVILGISNQDTLKDIRFSPSIIIAEYLNKLNINVFINDPNFTAMEINEILPFANYIDLLKGVEQKAVLIMKDYDEYKELTQSDIEKLGIFNTDIIIDNIGLFRDFSFSSDTVYHKIGDGNLKGLNK